MDKRNLRPSIDIDEPISKKVIALLLLFGGGFSWLSYIGWHRISNFETGLVFAIELIIAGSCLYGFFLMWIPRNLRTRYVWYLIDPEYNYPLGENALCQIRDDVPNVPVAFRVKISGWFGKSQVFIDRQPTDQWQIEVGETSPFGFHRVIIYDHRGIPFIPGRICCSDGIKHQLWLIEKFPDLDQHWMYIYSLKSQRDTLLGAMYQLREFSQPGGRLGNKWPVKVLHEFATGKVESALSTAKILGKQSAEEVIPLVKNERYYSSTWLDTLVKFAIPRSKQA